MVSRTRLARPSVRRLEDRTTPATFVVENLNDSGSGSLRFALNNANESPDADTITFQTGVAGTILLAGNLSITQPVTILGPGAGVVTVDANKTGRVFDIFRATPFTAAISGLTLANGTTAGDGGVIFSNVNLSLDGVTVTGGSATKGGGVAQISPGVLTVTKSTFTGNTAAQSGGGVAIFQVPSRPGSPTDAAPLGLSVSALSDSVVSGNSAKTGGGAYAARVALNIVRSTVAGNTAVFSGGGVAAVSHTGLFVSASTLSGNAAGVNGGGLYGYMPLAGNVRVENSTVSGNTAELNGGGAYVADGPFQLFNSTVVNNTADFDPDNEGDGGGVGVGIATADIRNSVIAGNFDASPDVADRRNDLSSGDGTLNVQFSLLGDTQGVSFNNIIGNVVNTAAKLGTLADNGGPTLTHLPAADSPLVDAGDPAFAGLTTDQRGTGFPRVVNGRIDIGSVERAAGPVVPTIRFTNNDSVIEGTGGSGPQAFLGIELSAASQQTVSFRLRTVEGTAKAVADYTPLDEVITLSPGTLGTSVFININPDALDEPGEFFTVELLDLVNVNPGTPTDATVDIIDDDEPPTAAITGFVAKEGNSGTTAFTFAVALAAESGQVVTIDYATAYGTATLADNDYQAKSGTLTFAPGETQQVITVLVNGDTAVETDETFEVNLTGGTNVDLTAPAVTKAFGTILNDDFAPPTGVTVKLAATPTFIPEFLGQSTVRAQLSKLSAVPVTVELAFAGTAKFGTDYAVAGTTITVPAGKLSATVLLSAIHDTYDEPNETAVVSIAAATGATPVGNPVTITIADDDAPGTKIKTTEVNDGDDQRSMICSLTVEFDGTAKVSPGDFNLEGLPASVKLNTAVTLVGGDTVVTFTFTGPGVSGCCSLPDGQYSLTYKGGILRRFHRLFGDGDGDGDVDAADKAGFLASYRTETGNPNYREAYDYDCDGVIAGADYFTFVNRFGTAYILQPGSD